MKTDAQLYTIIWTLTKEEKITYKIAIFCKNKCQNLVQKQKSRQKQFGLKLLLFESSQPTREDSNSNIFEQNYFFFDFYFCTPKNMKTDAQLYTIIWTLTKEEKITYKIAIFCKNKCQNLVQKQKSRQKQFGLKLLLFESSQPTREDSNSNIFEQNYFSFDFQFCTPKNIKTDAQLYTIIWTLTKEEKITYKIAIFCKNKCQNLVQKQKSRQKQFGLKLLLFESSQPTREDSNSNIFEQNYFFFDFYFCTPQNMKTDAQLYTIVWTLTKEEKITYKIAIFCKNKCQNLVQKQKSRQKQFGLKLLLFESSQPTPEGSSSNIFEQNYFFFDFYFCTAKNMKTDAQLYTIIWTLTKEEKITYKIAIFCKNKCQNLVQKQKSRQKQFGLKLLLFESSQPTREGSSSNIFEQNYFFFDFYFCTAKNMKQMHSYTLLYGHLQKKRK